MIPLAAAELACGYVLADDVYAESGAKLLPRGHEITPGLLELLRNYSLSSPIREPVLVLERSRKGAATGQG